MARKHKYGIADRRVIGLICGIVSGIAYGTNPLFAKPLLQSGVPILVMLFFRYGFSALILGMWMLGRKEAFHIQKSEIGILSLLGLLFAGSSIFLFASYEFIPSGLATTLVYLYPVFVALIMVFLRFYPSWQTWLSIIATFGGILLLSSPSQGSQIRLPGIILAVVSALCYSFYLVIVNRSSRIRHREYANAVCIICRNGSLRHPSSHPGRQFHARHRQPGGLGQPAWTCHRPYPALPAYAGHFIPFHRPYQDFHPRGLRASYRNPYRDSDVR